ncbi:aminotransferase class-III family protein, partial [Vibrio parahaemolyticus VPTS-2010_2]
ILPLLLKLTLLSLLSLFFLKSWAITVLFSSVDHRVLMRLKLRSS